MADANQQELWRQCSLRLCDRYLHEVVLAFQLCPWAEGALRGGRVLREVCLSEAPAPEDCLPFAERLGSPDGTTVDIGLLILPRHGDGWARFDAFAERVRRLIRAPPLAGAFFVAAFHPEGAHAFSGPAQLVSFLRRTAEPTLQFVRADVLDRLKQHQPDVSDQVARRNYDGLTLAEHRRRLEAVLADLLRDRDASHAALAAMGRAD